MSDCLAKQGQAAEENRFHDNSYQEELQLNLDEVKKIIKINTSIPSLPMVASFSANLPCIVGHISDRAGASPLSSHQANTGAH